jgi:cytochrome c-type biogenesis protein CcmE
MKNPYIIAIVGIAVLIGIIVSLYANTSSYVTFKEADDLQGKEVHVIGKLVKDSAMVYDPIKNPNHLEFYLVDSLNRVEKVIFHSPKPADLDRSERVVIIGKMREDAFYASSILLKCPSKYNEGTVEETEYKSTSCKKLFIPEKIS